MTKSRILLSWSSGKDSAWSLHLLRQDSSIEVVRLLTTLNAEYDRVAMHGVRRELLQRQSKAADVELWPVPLPNQCTDAQYAEIMTAQVERARSCGIKAIAFGDLFLEDLAEIDFWRLPGPDVGAVGMMARSGYWRALKEATITWLTGGARVPASFDLLASLS